MEQFFQLKQHGTTVRTEIMAGFTTFMAMAYILMVNAGMFAELEGQVTYNAVYIATAISAVIGTVLIGLLSNLPLAQASGMGLNAYFVYTVCFGIGLSYANALVLVLADGIIFILLTITGMFMEVGATNVILSPLLAPVAAAFGIDPIHFGMVFVFLLALGQATPPFGSTTFIACGISGERVAAVIRRLLPFVLVEYACALVFAYVPWFSTFLPNLMS